MEKDKKRLRNSCHFKFQTLLAIIWFFFCLIVNIFAQLYSDQLPNYPDAFELQDLGFKILPDLMSPELADTINIVSIALFFVIILFGTKRPQLIIRRFLFIWGTGFLLRALIVGDTRYPRSPNFKGPNYIPSNIVVGALSVLVGANSTITDFMYSGHTIAWILTALMVQRYTNRGIISGLFWILNIIGILGLISSKMHYTSDVVVSIVVALSLFLIYHLFLDKRYLQRWRPALVFEFEVEDLKKKPDIKMPITVTDGNGDVIIEFKVPAHQAAMHSDQAVAYFQPGRETSEVRMQVYNVFEWLDGEYY